MLGSEEGADFGAPWLDWIENRHRRVVGESIPLWPLVFHDAAHCARYAATPQLGHEDLAARWLPDMLWGYMALWGVRDATRWPAGRDAFAASLYVDEWHRRVGADQMLSHRYLTDDGEVEEAVFSSGVAIVANFASEACTVESVTVPPQGYAIRE